MTRIVSCRRLARVGAFVLVATLAACNPTWTKDGKPNDSSMPLPPGASTPQQAAGASDASPAPASKP